MLVKVISMVFSYLLGRTAHTGSAAHSLLLDTATLASLRKTLMLAIGALSGLMIFLGGLFTVLIDMILTTRGAGQILFSQASIVGSALIIISVGVQLALFSRRNWKPVAVHAEALEQQQAPIQPIVDAVADLIREFTDERKVARDLRTEQMTTAKATTGSPLYN